MHKLDQAKSEQKNMIVAMVLVIIVLMSFQFLNKKPAPTIEVPLQPVIEEVQNNSSENPVKARAIVQVDARIIPVHTPLVNGGISTLDGRFDFWELTAYRETIDEASPPVKLLDSNYTGFLAWSSSDVNLPNNQAWLADNDILTPETPVRLTWANDDVILTRTIAVDEAYMMTVTDTLKNIKSTPVSVHLSGTLLRDSALTPTRSSTVHEGFVALVNNAAEEEKYTAVQDKNFSFNTRGGWVGMTDKYWQTILIPDQNNAYTMNFKKDAEMLVADFKSQSMRVGAGETITQTTRIFAGAKDSHLISTYKDSLNIPRFDLTIDFGWFYFLTKPFLAFLRFLYALVGNMGVAILIFATLLRLLMLPIASKSYENMAKMKKIQPKIVDIQNRFKDDRARMQQEMMMLYKCDKVNPAAGCLPLLIQIPIFFALYKVLSVSLQMRHAPFFGWIQDLSARDPSSVFTLFGYLSWPIPGMLDLGVWPILMGLSMWIQQKMTPVATAEKSQLTVMRWMPFIFMFMMGQFAAGLVIYWTWSNLLSILQQHYIMRKVGK